MSDQGYSVFNAMTDIIAAPGRALDEVKDRGTWFWWPLLLTIVASLAAFAVYNFWVDFDWLIDEMIRGLPPGTPPETGEQMRGFMSPAANTAITSVTVVIMTFLIYLIQAVYLNLANKVTAGAEIGFGQWFSFSAWTGFVGIFNVLIMAVVILLADNNQLAQHDLLPLSINSLLIHANVGDPWFNWGNSLNLVHFWMLGLMSIGFARWTGSSMVKSTVIALLPWVAIFGIWAAVI